MSILCIGDSHVKRLKSFLDVYKSSTAAYDIASLCSVNYFGISGGSVSCDHHLGLLSSVVRHHRPPHLIACLGGNDLDVPAWDWSAECVVAKLITFLTQLGNRFLLKTVTILSYIPRQRTRSISPDLYKLRVIEANCLLQDFCRNHQLALWRLRGFFDSKQHILCDGIHLNHYGYHKLLRQLRGIQTIKRNSPSHQRANQCLHLLYKLKVRSQGLLTKNLAFN